MWHNQTADWTGSREKKERQKERKNLCLIYSSYKTPQLTECDAHEQISALFVCELADIGENGGPIFERHSSNEMLLVIHIHTHYCRDITWIMELLLDGNRWQGKERDGLAQRRWDSSSYSHFPMPIWLSASFSFSFYCLCVCVCPFCWRRWEEIGAGGHRS